MAGGNKGDIEVIDTDDPRNTWPTSAKALALTGWSKRTLENRVRDGSLHYVYDQANNRLFDPKSLDDASGTVSEIEVEADLTKGVLEQLRKALGDVTKANGSLLTLATQPAFEVLKALKKENKALRKRCRQLEDSRIKSIEAFEAALTASHEREIAKKNAESHQNRLDKGFDALIGQLPNIVNQLSFKKAIGGFVSSLTDEQKSLLFDMLRADQLEALSKIIPQPNGKKTDGTPEASSNGIAGKHAGES